MAASMTLALLFTNDIHGQSLDLTNNFQLSYQRIESPDAQEIFGLDTYFTLDKKSGYDSNVYDNTSLHTTAGFNEVGGSVFATSHWDRHAFTLGANARTRIFHKAHPGSFGNGSVSTSGRIDMTDSLQLEMEAYYDVSAGDRGDQRSGFSTEERPLDHTASISGELIALIGEVLVSLKSSNVLFVSDEAEDIDGFPQNRNDDTNLAQALTLRGSLLQSEQVTLFAEVGGNRTAYRGRTDSFGFARGSKGGHVAAGVMYSPNDTFQAEVAVGARRQIYDDTIWDAHTALTVDGWMNWQATDRLNVVMQATTSHLEESNVDHAAKMNYSALLQAGYMLQEDLRVFAQGSTLIGRRIGADDNSRLISVKAGVDYEMNKHFLLSTELQQSYSHTGQGAGEFYHDTTGWVGIEYQP